MITPNYVNFQQAKLLKEKGFEEVCEFCYSNIEEQILQVNNCNNLLNTYSKPEHWQVIKWLYSKYGILIYVKLGYGHEFVIQKTTVPFEIIYTDGTFKSPEEATNAALDYVLEKLI